MMQRKRRVTSQFFFYFPPEKVCFSGPKILKDGRDWVLGTSTNNSQMHFAQVKREVTQYGRQVLLLFARVAFVDTISHYTILLPIEVSSPFWWHFIVPNHLT